MKNGFVFMILFFCSCILQCQVLVPLKNYTSPNIGSLGNYGNVPVSFYTGLPQISIPIYDLKDGPISVPIHLDYNLSSVKPNKHPGWVGLGWSLSCGGYITRTVRGYYDECKDVDGNEIGYYSNYSKFKSSNTTDDYWKHTQAFCGMKSQCYELMADEFNFNFCGYSGRFYLNEDGKWSVVGDNVRVEFDSNTGFLDLNQLKQRIPISQWCADGINCRFFNKFTIITADGVRYSFGGISATEYSISFYQRNNSYLIPTTWYLTKIVSPNGHEVDLDYEVGNLTCEINKQYSETTATDGNGQNVPGRCIPAVGGRGSLFGFLLFPVYLKTIKSCLVDIDFNSSKSFEMGPPPGLLSWKSKGGSLLFSHFGDSNEDPANCFHVFMKDRTDIPSNFQWKLLNNIIIRAGADVKSFYFSYINNDKERLKLTSLIQNDKDNIIEKPLSPSLKAGPSKVPLDSLESVYCFVYNSNRMPNYVFASEDHWGYYNGRTDPFGSSVTFNEEYYNSRNPNYSLFAETLTKIRYPTGGYSTFEYEQNEYSRYVNPTKNSSPYLLDKHNTIGGGLRVSEIRSYTDDNRLAFQKKYYYCNDFPGENTNHRSSGILKSLPSYSVYYQSEFTKDYYDFFALWRKAEKFMGLVKVSSSGSFSSRSTNDDNVIIGYSTVYEEMEDYIKNTNGIIKYKFSNYDEDIWGESHRDESAYITNFQDGNSFAESSSKSMERGKLMSEEYFDSNKRLLKSIKYKYERTSDKYLKTIQQLLFTAYGDSYYRHMLLYKTFLYSYLPSYKVETLYDLSTGNASQTKEQYYTYNEDNLIKSEKQIINNKYLETSYTYTGDYARAAANSLSPSISNSLEYVLNDKFIMNKKVSRIQKNSNSKILDAELYIYKEDNYKHIVPSKKMVFDCADRSDIPFWSISKLNSFDPRFKQDTSYTYDERGNIIEINKTNGEVTTFLWGFNNQYPVAKIQNCSLKEVFEVIGDLNRFSSDYYPDYDKLITLRQKLKNAQIKTFKYNLFGNILNETFPNGTFFEYRYNHLGGLEKRTDSKDFVIESYKYVYRK